MDKRSDIKTKAAKIAKKGKLTPKEIYRTIAFKYRQGDKGGIKVSLICDIVTNMFYPFDLKGDTKAKYREMIKGVLDKYTVKGEINEEDFCLAMYSLQKYMTEENLEDFLTKIFKRFDKDKDGFLNKEEFKNLMNCYQPNTITDKESNEVFELVVANQTDKNFMEMNSFIVFTTKNPFKIPLH